MKLTKGMFEHHFIYLQGVLSFIQENSFEMKGVTYRGRKYYHSMIVIYKPVTGKNKNKINYGQMIKGSRNLFTHMIVIEIAD